MQGELPHLLISYADTVIVNNLKTAKYQLISILNNHNPRVVQRANR